MMVKLQHWKTGVNEAIMMAHDWLPTEHNRPRFFLLCRCCHAMFLTPFPVSVCRECWLEAHQP